MKNTVAYYLKRKCRDIDYHKHRIFFRDEEGIESRHLLIYITLWRVIKYFGNPTRPPRLVPPPRIDLSAGRRSQQVFYREKTRVVDKVTRMLIGNFLNDVNPSYIEAILTRLFSHTHR